jgi:hypothetical protein
LGDRIGGPRLLPGELGQARAANPDPDAAFAAALLQLERLSDAVSEGELADMGLDAGGAWRALERIIHGLRHRG